MNRKILLCPDGDLCSMEELQMHLKFHYLDHNGFESPEDRAKIEKKGIEKFEQGNVTQEALMLGQCFAGKIRDGYFPSVSIRWVSESVGYGLFCEEEIKSGSFVGEYTGIVRENNRRYIESINNYCYEYPVFDSIGRSLVIDATQGNLMRFINHSNTPNLKPAYAFINGFYHCIFIALCFIAKESQLTYDYGKSYWYIRESPQQF